jgi:hypothetical protein
MTNGMHTARCVGLRLKIISRTLLKEEQYISYDPIIVRFMSHIRYLYYAKLLCYECWYNIVNQVRTIKARDSSRGGVILVGIVNLITSRLEYYASGHGIQIVGIFRRSFGVEATLSQTCLVV